MEESFKISTQVMLERLKDLESDNFPERPNTAQVMGRIHESREPFVSEGETQNTLTVSQTETCDTCKLEIDVEDIPTHVVQCLKEAKRCKVCQESLHKS